ncbi:hypothetical protein D9M71_670360 [compost metagenome]
MLADLAVAKNKARLDIVDHRAPGLAEQVGRNPVRTAVTLIGVHVVEGQGKVLGSGAEHSPHVAGVLAAQGAEGRVAEDDIIAVAGNHRFSVQALESLVEAGDQSTVGIAHEAGPFPME